MKTSDILINTVMHEIGRISLNRISAIKRVRLKEFLCRRVDFYGINGYMFTLNLDYKIVLWGMKSKDELNLIACYILERNWLEIDLDTLTYNQRHTFEQMKRNFLY